MPKSKPQMPDLPKFKLVVENIPKTLTIVDLLFDDCTYRVTAISKGLCIDELPNYIRGIGEYIMEYDLPYENTAVKLSICTNGVRKVGSQHSFLISKNPKAT